MRAALEKIVFFEWRLSEIAAELSAAEARCASAELERGRADETAHAAQSQAQAARIRIAELEADRARLAALLARPAHVFAAPSEVDRDRTAQLEAELAEARSELALHKQERARWLNEMIEQARSGDEAPAALAQFISELRGDIIALRERQKQSDALLVSAGLEPPAVIDPQPPPVAAHREPEPVEAARKMWAEGRLGTLPPPGAPDLAHGQLPAHGAHDLAPALRAQEPAGLRPYGREPVPALEALGRASFETSGRASFEAPGRASFQPLGRESIDTLGRARFDDVSGRAHESGPARALAEQCLRALASRDPARREQAARHLAALPLPSAAPLLASALGSEQEPRARAQLGRALAACGGDGAAHLVEQLQEPAEHALVRLAALEALTQPGPGSELRALAALRRAAADPAPAVRRRAAAIAASTEGAAEIFALLGTDEDASVRRMKEAARNEAPQAPEEPVAAARDVAREALLAVQAAMFGLTDGELAETLNVPEPEALVIAAGLVSSGRLGRRGKRLIAAQGA
jgi:hypothetical protein